ncbi:MAG TPA: hypothetical protein VD704_03835 [Gaiellaceae bacterium]|nr:hypothetical protein [Gaiellaceae bacterium]
MVDESAILSREGEAIEAVSEMRLAELLRELGARRAPLASELERLDDLVERLEVELARRGSGG